MKLKQPLSVKDLAATYNAKLIGDETILVGSVNEIHKLTPDSITFVDHPKYYQKVLQSIASVIIINSEQPCPSGKALLVVKEPFEIYNQIALAAQPFVPATAAIAESATIGANTIIQPNVFIGENVVIGSNCIIHPNTTIYNNAVLGDNVIIHANTTIGSDAFYFNQKDGVYRKMHSIGRAIIQDNVEIGSSCSIDAGVSGDTIIGKGSKLDSQVHIGHGVVVGENCLFAAQVAVAGKTTIGNGVILYGKVGISKDLKIGDNVVMLASSNTDKDLEADNVYYGSPAILARDKWKEMVYTRQLPKVWHKIPFTSDQEK